LTPNTQALIRLNSKPFESFANNGKRIFRVDNQYRMLLGGAAEELPAVGDCVGRHRN
jgi:hypothetical protein